MNKYRVRYVSAEVLEVDIDAESEDKASEDVLVCLLKEIDMTGSCDPYFNKVLGCELLEEE